MTITMTNTFYICGEFSWLGGYDWWSSKRQAVFAVVAIARYLQHQTRARFFDALSGSTQTITIPGL